MLPLAWLTSTDASAKCGLSKHLHDDYVASGNIFLDSDFEMAKKITLSILNIDFSSLMSNEQKDSKTLLQEFLQASNEALPNYVTTESDLNGSLTFISEVRLPNFNISGRGEGKSKKIAEQHAAAEVGIGN